MLFRIRGSNRDAGSTIDGQPTTGTFSIPRFQSITVSCHKVSRRLHAGTNNGPHPVCGLPACIHSGHGWYHFICFPSEKKQNRSPLHTVLSVSRRMVAGWIPG
ncbi:hypothetical protein BC832DRAFT_355366 [Gaertneriomyces semiglobifer]|nr:hypothetical protein BC832DRAFT_355366 [Gaertneriomyces semiglobifer]